MRAGGSGADFAKRTQFVLFGYLGSTAITDGARRARAVLVLDDGYSDPARLKGSLASNSSTRTAAARECDYAIASGRNSKNNRCHRLQSPLHRRTVPVGNS